jgi:2Fe-2S ferredoxin
MKHKVTLKPTGNIVEVEEAQNLLEALREQEVYIKSSCGGVASCSDCIIKIVSGEDHLTPPPFSELKLLGNVFHITKERLACQTCVTGDVTIDISKHDKASDEEKLRSKTTSFSKKIPTRVRKESEVQQLSEERTAAYEKKDDDRTKKDEQWQKHWEKQPSNAPKKLAGGKRPKFFDTDKIDYEKKDFSRPLSEEKRKINEEKKQTSSDEPKKDFKKFRN